MTTYLTVSIPYVNARPHLGYAYELVLADVYARSRRLAGEPLRFVGGTDDYSLKNVLAAEAVGMDTARFVSRLASRFAALAGPLGLSFDDVLSTSSDPRHRPAVERLWRACAARGDLYRARYEGDYCVSCEQFWASVDLVGGRCPEHHRPLERVAEENWFFRLSAYQAHVEHLLTSGELTVHPEPFRQEVLAFVRRGLEDLSVSRSARRARGWGIPVPGDPGQVIYVWFDALVNYLSALGYGDARSAQVERWWRGAERRVHVVGKGIVRFHAVYWPAFLASAGEPPPTRVEVHPCLSVGGEKLSKSAGVSLEPNAVTDRYGTDALRWWFARDVSRLADTDFSPQRLVARANEDLANGLGNLAGRVLALVRRIPRHAAATPAAPLAAVHGLEQAVRESLAEFDLRAATAQLCDAVGALNRDLERTEPWRAGAPGGAASPAHAALLGGYLASLGVIARAASPIVPRLAAELAARLADGDARPHSGPLFPRLG
jgi:methionyl-tRNA synthetase